MKLNTSTAILIGSVLIAGVLLFNGSTNSTIADYSKKSYDKLSYLDTILRKQNDQLVIISRTLNRIEYSIDRIDQNTQ